MPYLPLRYRRLLEHDPRYRWEAYLFVQESLIQAQKESRKEIQATEGVASDSEAEMSAVEPHLTGQELCEALRKRAIEQYGYLAKTVLNNWGVHTTGDFGEIVYNLINIECLKKSPGDRREDFDDVYQFDEVFRQDFRISIED